MNLRTLREDIPALSTTAYLNTGASGPSPRRVVRAAQRAIEHQEYDAHTNGTEYDFAFATYDETREAIAHFVGADAAEIALTHSTTAAINLVATALDWGPDDVVVRTDLEHPAGILPWDRLRTQEDVEIRVIDTDRGRIDLDDVTAAVRNASLVCISAITWTHGTKIPIEAIVEIAHDAGAKVLVDAVQVPGQTRLDVDTWDADFVAAAGHKWMLGPWGAGFLYARADIANDLTPAAIGYRSVEDPHASPPSYYAGARRFEVGTASPVPYAGMQEAIDVIEEVGIDSIESRIADMTAFLKAHVDADVLLSPREFESGLVTFRVDDPDATVRHLTDQGIVIRSIPPIDAVRASVHAFNTEADIEALLDGLATFW